MAAKNVRADNTRAIAGTTAQGAEKPKAFTSLAEILNSRPGTAGNPQERMVTAAEDAGRSMIAQLHQSFFAFERQPLPGDDRSAERQAQSAAVSLGRVVSTLASSYGYALMYADKAAERLGSFMATEEADRDGVAGFASEAQRLMEQASEFDARAAWVCDVINGATDEFEKVTGSAWKPAQPASAPRIRTDAEAKQVTDGVAAFLAARGGKRAA